MDKAHGNAILALQEHSAPVGVPAQAGFQRGYQITDSENHIGWSGKKAAQRAADERALYESVYSGVSGSFGKGSSSPSYDTGGNFFTQKVKIEADNSSAQTITGKAYETPSGYWAASYTGPILPTILGGFLLPSVSQGNLDTLGATAIAQCAPTNQVAAAANFMREIRTEGLPKLFGTTLWKDRTRAALGKGAGGEYLNVEFGWKPMVGDMKAIAFAVANAHTILDQYERDSGRLVRRRFGFPVETTQSVTNIRSQRAYVGNYATGVFNPVPAGGDPTTILRPGDASGTLWRKRETWKRVWFSGAFTYHIPYGYNSRNHMVASARKAQVLLGLDLTPEVVWNAAPWTWAIDWFSNAGDVVANLSDWATDGLVMKYGYVMEHSIARDTYYVTKRGGLMDPDAQPASIVISVETKRRKKASPFGFGLTWSGLSPRQIAISTALGLTQGFRKS